MLASERIVFRDFALDDSPAVHAYASRPEVRCLQPWGSTMPRDSREYVELAAARAQSCGAPTRACDWARGNRRVIGAGSVVINTRQHGHGEIDYFLQPAYWGQGMLPHWLDCSSSPGYDPRLASHRAHLRSAEHGLRTRHRKGRNAGRGHAPCGHAAP